jgi:hypothetical protein
MPEIVDRNNIGKTRGRQEEMTAKIDLRSAVASVTKGTQDIGILVREGMTIRIVREIRIKVTGARIEMLDLITITEIV